MNPISVPMKNLISVVIIFLVPSLVMSALSEHGADTSAISLSEINQFRGPSGQGHYAGSVFPIRWSVLDSIEWKTELPGKAWSSPIWIKSSNSLVMTNAVEKEEMLSLEVLSLDLESGTENWTHSLFKYRESPRIHKKNSHASPTPYFDGERIFVHFGNLGTACLSLQGKVIWKKRYDYSPVHGSGCSPVVHGELLLFSADGYADPCLYALDKRTGEISWKAKRESDPRKNFSFCTPLVIECEGRVQIVSPASDYVFSYDLMGRQLWKSKYPGGYSVVPRPVYGEGMVFVSSGYDRPTTYAIKANGTGDVTKTHLAWKTSKSAHRNASPLLVRTKEDGLLFFMAADHGVVSCLSAKTGELKWMERVAGSCSASLLYAGGRIYLIDELGKTFVFDAKAKFRLVAENDLRERTLASPIAVPGALIIRTEERVWKIKGQANR